MLECSIGRDVIMGMKPTPIAVTSYFTIVISREIGCNVTQSVIDFAAFFRHRAAPHIITPYLMSSHLMTSHLLSSHVMSSPLLPSGGRILFIGSLSSVGPGPTVAVYAATKAFLQSFTMVSHVISISVVECRSSKPVPSNQIKGYAP